MSPSQEDRSRAMETGGHTAGMGQGQVEAGVGIAQLSCPAHMDRVEGGGIRGREKGKLRLRRKGWAARKWVDTGRKRLSGLPTHGGQPWRPHNPGGQKADALRDEGLRRKTSCE